MEHAKLRSIIVLLALAVASSLVVVLALQKRDLMTRIDTLTERIRHPYVGMYVPAVTLSAVTGDSVLLGGPPGGHVQVLFVFSTSCQYCKASLPAWKQIAAQLAAGERVEVVGVSLDSVEATRRYVAEYHLDFPVVSFTDRKLRALYRSSVVPQTLLLDAEGTVQYARLGAVMEDVVVDSIITQANSWTGTARAAVVPTNVDSVP